MRHLQTATPANRILCGEVASDRCGGPDNPYDYECCECGKPVEDCTCVCDICGKPVHEGGPHDESEIEIFDLNARVADLIRENDRLGAALGKARRYHEAVEQIADFLAQCGHYEWVPEHLHEIARWLSPFAAAAYDPLAEEVPA